MNWLLRAIDLTWRLALVVGVSRLLVMLLRIGLLRVFIAMADDLIGLIVES